MNEITKKVKVKGTILELLKELMGTLDYRERNIKQDYVMTDELEECKNWKTGELEERNKWDYIDKEELTEEDNLELEAIETVRKALEKLI